MKKLKKLIYVAIVAIFAATLSSCEEAFNRGVVGCWELESDEMGYVVDYAVDKYCFYSDGTGVYGYYDRQGYWIGDVPFVWGYGWDGPGSLYVDFGKGDIYYYYYEFDGSHLVLSEDAYFRTWLDYIPTGR